MGAVDGRFPTVDRTPAAPVWYSRSASTVCRLPGLVSLPWTGNLVVLFSPSARCDWGVLLPVVEGRSSLVFAVSSLTVFLGLFWFSDAVGKSPSALLLVGAVNGCCLPRKEREGRDWRSKFYNIGLRQCGTIQVEVGNDTTAPIWQYGSHLVEADKRQQSYYSPRIALQAASGVMRTP